MFNKKGEITTQQIVLLIILIVSFIVILFLLFGFDFFGQTDKEACHYSVIMRGTKLPDSVTPLDCSRTYICLSEDGTCERMTNPDIKKVETKEEIYEILAEEMADCWWMFGEGKVNYADPAWREKNYCSICTQFVLDNSIDEIENINGEVDKDDFYNYLSKTVMPDKEITYAEYFLGTKDINKLKRDLSVRAGSEVTFGKIELNKQYFIVMGITSESNLYTWVLTGAVIGGVAVVGVATAGIGTAAFMPVLFGVVAGGAAGHEAFELSDLVSPTIGAVVVQGDGIDNKFMAPTIQEANSNEFKLLGCDDIITSS